jgi:hypothetical protein
MSEEELRKDVFTWYGSVAYAVQCFEVELSVLLLAHERLDKPDSTSDELDRLDETLSLKTLGQLIGEVKKRFWIHPKFETILKTYLQKRNYFTHRFFFENAHKLQSAEGCTQLVGELQGLYATFMEADKISQLMSRNVRVASGIDEDVLQNMIDREIKSGDV